MRRFEFDVDKRELRWLNETFYCDYRHQKLREKRRPCSAREQKIGRSKKKTRSLPGLRVKRPINDKIGKFFALEYRQNRLVLFAIIFRYEYEKLAIGRSKINRPIYPSFFVFEYRYSRTIDVLGSIRVR